MKFVASSMRPTPQWASTSEWTNTTQLTVSWWRKTRTKDYVGSIFLKCLYVFCFFNKGGFEVRFYSGLMVFNFVPSRHTFLFFLSGFHQFSHATSSAKSPWKW